jgi:hypothetical protein
MEKRLIGTISFIPDVVHRQNGSVSAIGSTCLIYASCRACNPRFSINTGLSHCDAGQENRLQTRRHYLSLFGKTLPRTNMHFFSLEDKREQSPAAITKLSARKNTTASVLSFITVP